METRDLVPSSAAAIESRDLLRDRATYPSFGLTIAHWMVVKCGFADFADRRPVHAVTFEAGLLEARPAIERHAGRLAVEFSGLRGPSLPRLGPRAEPARAVTALLRYVNGVLREAFGVQIERIPAGDAYVISWSSVGARFYLEERAGAPDPAGAGRPRIACRLRRQDPVAAAAEAERDLFIARQYYAQPPELVAPQNGD